MLAAYHQRYPLVQLDLSTGPSGDMLEGVFEGRLAAYPVLIESTAWLGRDHPVVSPNCDGGTAIPMSETRSFSLERICYQ